MATAARHILLLTERDWTHPRGGGTGADLHGQVARWLAWGHRVTVVAGSYPGAARVEEPAPGLTIHRMGNRLTVFPCAAWAVLRGLGRDADVALEVVDGVAFLTPLWLRRPRVALVRGAGRGRAGALALKLLYRGTRLLTVSEGARGDLVALGFSPDGVHVAPHARQSLDVLEAAAAGGAHALAGEETLKAAGMAAATLASNAIALLFTVLFAHILGADGYGSLAAIISTFIILSVPGSALQVAVARETALGRLGDAPRLASTMVAWRRRLAACGLAVTAAALLLHEQIAALIAVRETYAAAATATVGCLWIMLSVERGALQGIHAYRPVAISVVLEALGRLTFGLILVAFGLGVTGAALGTPAAMLAVMLGLMLVSRRRLGPAPGGPPARPLGRLVGDAWPAVVALFLVAVLQNVDVILVKRQIGGDAAGAYAAAAVAAKAVVWIAIGVGLYLLPEATRAVRRGTDPRPALVRALALVGAVAVPMLVVYAVAPELVLRIAFGPDTVQASSALPVLGVAMTLLACGYLCVQYMLALGEVRFLYALGAVAAAEVVVLAGAGLTTLTGFAAAVLALQAIAALSVLGFGLARRPVVRPA
jgi:O-antigen/teichoic acid export membrane protein